MAEPRIEFRGVRKQFRRRNRSAALRDAIPRLVGGLFGRVAPAEPPFVALDDVSFAVAPGEVLGIVGPNGAGKSTSLRIAAGIYRPDAGTVRVEGRVAALIELSAGFHPDLSGRENVYLAGALVGLRKREVEAVFDRIVEFAGIGDFLESPVHTYSSGMAMRLGFAVAAHVPAEVMLVDEVLAVGDIEFQVKCIQRMSERRQEGVSVLFVSHHLPTVEQFCDRVLFVNHGKILAEGSPREVIGAYRAFVARQSHESQVRGTLAPQVRRGTGVFFLEDVRIEGEHRDDPGAIRHRGRLRVSARWKALQPLPRPVIGVSIHTLEGALCAELKTTREIAGPDVFQGEGILEIECEDVSLMPGEYEVSIFAYDQAGFAPLDQHQRLYSFRVIGDPGPGQGGIAALRPRWTFGGPGAGRT